MVLFLVHAKNLGNEEACLLLSKAGLLGSDFNLS